jgi:hypothetical protein
MYFIVLFCIVQGRTHGGGGAVIPICWNAEISTQMSIHSKPYQLAVCLWLSHTDSYILIHKIISAISLEKNSEIHTVEFAIAALNP